MKKNYTTDAINLKNYSLNDNDSIIVMFSKTKGLISAVAKGAKRPKSKLGARIQMFIANKLMLLEGKNLDTIQEAQSLNTFSRIRSDLDKLSYSMYISEIVSNFCSNKCSQDENNESIYNLIFSTYNKISNSKTKEEVLLSVLKFQIKLMDILGWGIDFKTCSICQKEIETNALFSFNLGSFVCVKCANNDVSCIKIHDKIREFMQTLLVSDFDVETKYDKLVNLKVLDKCFNFMKKYIDNISHKKTKIFEVLNCVSQ